MVKSADAFRTISEVADWLGVQTHVLRFWESKFTQVKPVKRAGGRRYYRPVDMLLLGGIQKLLHEDGLTIKGVQKILREKGIAHVSALSPEVDGDRSVDLNAPSPDTPIKSAPFTQVAPQDVEPATADVVPFMQDSRPDDAIKPVDRPSFTQDAVVIPDEQVEPTDAAEPTLAQPKTEDDDTGLAKEPIVGSTPENIPQESVIKQELEDEVVARKPEPHVTADADMVTDAQGAVTDTPADLVATPEPEFVTPEPLAKALAAAEQSAVAAEPGVMEEEAAQEETPTPVVEEPIPEPPSFLNRSSKPTAPVTDNLPPEGGAAEPVQTVETHDDVVEVTETSFEAAIPKPKVVDIPDTPFESGITASPRALSALAKTKSLTSAQASKIAPMLTQLRNLRDRMGAARKE